MKQERRFNSYFLFIVILMGMIFIAVAIGMTAFAISNVVTFNDKVIANIHLPEAILNLCGIFRASSRIFYYYVTHDISLL